MSAGILAHGRRWTTWTVRGVSIELDAVSAWLLPFASVLYLALEGGGYDTVVRSQVGVVLWWIVLIGALAGILPRAIARRGWIAVGLLAALGAWSALSLSWTESTERTVIEVGRVGMLLAALILGLCIAARTSAPGNRGGGHGDGRRRHLGAALAAAPGVVPGQRPGGIPRELQAARLPAQLLERGSRR